MGLKALVIGGGGREHALVWKLAQSQAIDKIYASPGNPGIAALAECIPGTDWLAIDADLTVVGPEAPLVTGVVDRFRAAGRKIIGPTAAAARLEGSKAFSKEFMLRAGIPTARAFTANDPAAARAHIGDFGYPVVLKADGLAAGKGVIIAASEPEALEALDRLPPGPVVIEEFLQGEEVSFIVLADGERFWPLEPTQDHKTIGDGDTGPNTGGMGAYCDSSIITERDTARVIEEVIRPSLSAMVDTGVPYTGFLYAGLMMTPAGPKVLEFNARLGDPETQALMHRLESDLAATLLDGEPLRWKSDPSVCVVMAAHGYPGEVRTGDVIHGVDTCGAVVFHAGTRRTDRGLETAGGRVLGVTASGPDLQSAIDSAYWGVTGIRFDGMQYRKDIAAKGLKRW